MVAKAMDAFDAFARNEFPVEGGCIFHSAFPTASAHPWYGIIPYERVDSMASENDSLILEATAGRVLILVDSPALPDRPIERQDAEIAGWTPSCVDVPLELVAANGAKLFLYTRKDALRESFSVKRPVGMGFSIVFFPRPDMFETIRFFLEKSYIMEAGIPPPDAEEASGKTVQIIGEFFSREGHSRIPSGKKP